METRIGAILNNIVQTFFGVSKAVETIASLGILERKESAISILTKQAKICKKILQIFRKGSLFLDEVDLILHPLRSELNWPIGRKQILDFSRSSR